MVETLIDGDLSEEQDTAKAKLQAFLDENMAGPMSDNARILVDAFGDPIE